MPETPYEYVNRTYNRNFYPGMEVEMEDGREGIVARKRHYNHYVWVRVAGGKLARPYHPCDVKIELSAAQPAPKGDSNV